MQFCPECANMLLYELPNAAHPARFYCPTCPYVYNLVGEVKIKRKVPLVRKEFERIISHDDTKGAPSSEVRCPKCGHDRASHNETQTRSTDEPATSSTDEPATILYQCLNESCRHNWRKN